MHAHDPVTWDPGDPAVKSLAVFTDVHCNEAALRACLKDLEQRRAQDGYKYPLAFLGDTVDTGPCPLETIDLAESASSIHIRGNHEIYLSECMRGEHRRRYASRQWRYVPWTLAKIGEKRYQDFERSLLDEWTSDDGCLRLVHASPDSFFKVPAFFEYSSVHVDQEIKSVFSFRRVTFVGHTHLGAFYERPAGEIWVNAGSVGYPFLGKPDTHKYVPYSSYVVCTYHVRLAVVQLRLCRVPYPLGAVLADYERTGVLLDCAPYSRAVFLQSVLNRSVVYQALRAARAAGGAPEQDDVFLENYLRSQGYEDEIGTILGMQGDRGGSRRLEGQGG